MEETQMKIRPNDIVRHIPTGEKWCVCGVNYEKDGLIPCGYPFPSLAKISDCELVETRELPQDGDMKTDLLKNGLKSYVENQLDVSDENYI